jgi:hypothetical protein
MAHHDESSRYERDTNVSTSSGASRPLHIGDFNLGRQTISTSLEKVLYFQMFTPRYLHYSWVLHLTISRGTITQQSEIKTLACLHPFARPPHCRMNPQIRVRKSSFFFYRSYDPSIIPRNFCGFRGTSDRTNSEFVYLISVLNIETILVGRLFQPDHNNSSVWVEVRIDILRCTAAGWIRPLDIPDHIFQQMNCFYITSHPKLDGNFSKICFD